MANNANAGNQQQAVNKPAAGKHGNNLPLWGNEKTMNLNPMILTNVLSSPYFKVQLYELKTYHEVVDEIYFKVTHVEPWEKGSRKTAGQTGMCGGVRGVGTGGIVSTAFCLLYKLFTLKLTRKQVMGLITHTDSPYIRALGFMYIRYTQPPPDLVDWYDGFLDDEEELDVKAGGGCIMTVSEMLRSFLTKLEWFSTLFPRIPVPVQKMIDQQMKARPRKVPQKEGKEEEEEQPAESARQGPEHKRSRSPRKSPSPRRSPTNRSRSRSHHRDRHGASFDRELERERDRQKKEREGKDRDRGDRERNRGDRAPERSRERRAERKDRDKEREGENERSSRRKDREHHKDRASEKERERERSKDKRSKGEPEERRHKEDREEKRHREERKAKRPTRSRSKERRHKGEKASKKKSRSRSESRLDAAKPERGHSKEHSHKRSRSKERPHRREPSNGREHGRAVRQRRSQSVERGERIQASRAEST